MKVLKHFLDLNIWVKAIFFFCVIGLLSNIVLVSRDIAHDGVLLRLHIGFLILYAGQVVFILLHERQVWALAALQGIMALSTNADFTFISLVRTLGNFVYACIPGASLEHLKVFQYVVISLSFTLQMLGAFALFSLLPKSSPAAPPPDATSTI